MNHESKGVSHIKYSNLYF